MAQSELGYAPPDNGMSLVTEMRAVAGSIREQTAKYQAVMNVLERRKSEVTWTLALSVKDDWVAYMLNDALLGMRLHGDVPVVRAAKPLHQWIELQSLKKHCSKCDLKEGSCGRKGKYHDIVYKTETKSGDFAEHADLKIMGIPREVGERAKVDPETGRFQLDPLEAKKCLRQYGENVANRRYPERWLVRDVQHHAQYVHNRPLAARSEEALTVAD